MILSRPVHRKAVPARVPNCATVPIGPIPAGGLNFVSGKRLKERAATQVQVGRCASGGMKASSCLSQAYPSALFSAGALVQLARQFRQQKYIYRAVSARGSG